ncbi:hypothetical protein [Pontibacter pamirensis]|uniref:hypothetical protein n=1 Tax=Pontibacter pamirensis TaxID=2562824 RepID=UPI00138A6BCD|nr:hypothetical protein [Pontibacter pamirensis]
MILYENGFIRLEYDASTEMLYVDGPDVQEYALMRVYEASNIIVGAIGKYNIKRLLIDSSETVVDLCHEDYKVVMNQFTRNLMKTSLQKVVRVANRDAARESGVEKYVKQVNQRAKPSLAFQNFTSRAAAIAWLWAE